MLPEWRQEESLCFKGFTQIQSGISTSLRVFEFLLLCIGGVVVEIDPREEDFPSTRRNLQYLYILSLNSCWINDFFNFTNPLRTYGVENMVHRSCKKSYWQTAD